LTGGGKGEGDFFYTPHPRIKYGAGSLPQGERILYYCSLKFVSKFLTINRVLKKRDGMLDTVFFSIIINV
jgi:hypothetical protein